MTQKPAVGLTAVPGRRQATLEVATQLEKEGFTGLYCPSLGDGMALCEALSYATNEIPFGMCGESRPASTSQPGATNFVDDALRSQLRDAPPQGRESAMTLVLINV